MPDQLEIIGPDGRIAFHDLDQGKGFTNIGRHPENDIVIDSPHVAPFHAVLDHRQKPYHLILLSQEGQATIEGQSLPPNTSKELHNWDSVELNGHMLVLLEGAGTAPYVQQPPVTYAAPAGVPAPVPMATAPAAGGETPLPSLPAPTAQAGEARAAPTSLDELDRALQRLELLEALPPDHTDPTVLVSFKALTFALDVGQQSSLDFNVDVEQSATFEATVTNGGDIVASFDVSVVGLDPSWVTISPPQLNLLEGERGTVLVSLTPPRLPTSHAGANYFSVVVTSPNYPGRSSATGGMLAINPYYEFGVGEPTPKQQTIPWSKRWGQATLPITNRGNGDVKLRLEGEDDERGLNFEFQAPDRAAAQARQTELSVPADQTRSVTVNIHVLRPQFFGLLSHTYPYTLTATPLAGQQSPRSVAGQVNSAPLIGPWHIALLALVLIGLVVLIFRPTIDLFAVTPSEMSAGQSATLSWSASPFVSLRIDPDIGTVIGPQGSKTITPTNNITYRLVASNFLTLLHPTLFSASREAAVIVDPVLPSIKFSIDKSDVVVGEPVTLWWEVGNAEEVTLFINDVPQTLPPEQHTGNRTFFPDRDTIYRIVAINPYTPPDGVSAKIAIKAVGPTPTPLPLPVIQRFDVQPGEITAGQTVKLDWAVTGVDKVTIAPLTGDFPPSGSIIQSPAQTIAYRLTATNGQTPVTLIKQVIVNPPPTPTPVPGTPKIEFFTASPSSVFVGSPESKNIKLAWSVSGDTTDIQITGPDFGKASGLPKQGTRTVGADKSTVFILTAFNGSLSASQTVQVKVTVPVPSIGLLNPPSATAGSAGFTLIVNGSNFVPGSVVRWEGANRSTTFVSTTELRAFIPATDLTTSGTYNITVFNPAPGGGSSNPAPFTVSNPVPIISNISPNAVTYGDPGFTLIVNGSNFVTTSKVRWEGTDRATTFLNGNQLTTDIPASLINTPRIVTVEVTSPGTTTPLISNPVTFTINVSNPVPIIGGLNPTWALVNSPTNVTLTVTGTNFVANSVVEWNGIPLSKVGTSTSTTITVSIPNIFLTSAGTANITVFSPVPGGGRSSPLPFTIINPTPTISPGGLNPATRIAGTGSFTLLVSGTNFVSGATVQWNGNPLGTATVISSTQLSIVVGGNNILEAKTYTVTVTNPGTAASGAQNFTTTAPSLTLTPSGGSIGSGSSLSVTVTISPVQTVARPVQLVSSNLVVVAVPTTTVTIPGGSPSAAFNVSNSGTAGGTATITATVPSIPTGPATATFSVPNPSPFISLIAPTSTPAGGLPFPLTITGTGFVSNSLVQWGSTTLTPTAVFSSTQLEVSIPASEIADISLSPISVSVVQPIGPCSGSCVSGPASFTLTAPTVTLTPAGPINVYVGDGNTMTVTTSIAMGATTLVTLTASSGLTVPGSVSIPAATNSTTFIFTGTAPSLSETITATLPVPLGSDTGTASVVILPKNPSPSITMLSPASATAGGINFTLTITGTGFVSGAVVNWQGQADLTPFSIAPTQIQVTVPASYIATAGTPNIRVTNPLPCFGSCPSGPIGFTITNPTIVSLLPSPINIPISSSTTMTVTVSAPQNNTLVTLSAVPGGVVTIPASVTISGGATFATFLATGVTTGTTTITATLPISLGGDAKSATVTVP